MTAKKERPDYKAENIMLCEKLATIGTQLNELRAEHGMTQRAAYDRELNLLRKLEALVTEREGLQNQLAALQNGDQCVIPKSEEHAIGMLNVAQSQLDQFNPVERKTVNGRTKP